MTATSIGVFVVPTCHCFFFWRCIFPSGWSMLNHFNQVFHIETSHLICSVNEVTGFYMKCNTGLKWVKNLWIKPFPFPKFPSDTPWKKGNQKGTSEINELKEDNWFEFGTCMAYWLRKFSVISSANTCPLRSFQASIYLCKVRNGNTETICEICSKLTIKTQRRHTYAGFSF